MNSDQWEKLWREQAAPTSTVNLDKFHQRMNSRPEDWEREINDNEWMLLKLLLLVALISGSDLFIGEFNWGEWIKQLANLLILGLLLIRRLERRNIYRDFGVPLRTRLDRMECLLLARQESWMQAALFAGAIALLGASILSKDIFRGLGWTGRGIAVVALLVGMAYVWKSAKHADQVRLGEALRRINRARAGLGGEPPAAD